MDGNVLIKRVNCSNIIGTKRNKVMIAIAIKEIYTSNTADFLWILVNSLSRPTTPSSI